MIDVRATSARVEATGSPIGTLEEPLSLEGVQVLAALVELSTPAAAALLPAALDVSIPGSLLVSVWSWYPHGEERGPSRLAELRLGCQHSTIRYMLALASVYEGDESELERLRAAGVPAERGSVTLRVFHDVALADVESERAGFFSARLPLRDSIDPHGLQWNFSPFVQPYPGEGSEGGGGGGVLGVVQVRHEFGHMRRGGALALALRGPLAAALDRESLGPTIGSLIARGSLRLEAPVAVPGI